MSNADDDWDVRYWPMLLKKDFGGVGQTTLIQIREQTRNIDSRIHLPGFFRFNFLFHSSHAVTFSTASTMNRRTQREQIFSAVPL